MRFGICGSMVARQPDGTGVEVVEQACALGYDYIELSLAHLAALPEAEFMALRQRVAGSGISCEACNNFFPKSVRLTGSAVNWARVEEYIRHAVGRAAALGVQVIVFGSSVAKNVPEGFPMYRAWQQIDRVLHLTAAEAGPHGITIAIEPLNRQESNIVNSVAEGLALMQRVDRPEVRVLADAFHMAKDDEDLAILQTAGANLRHVHFARLEGRGFPTELESRFTEFFQQLAAAGYTGRVSVEGFSQDFYRDAERALAVLKSSSS